MLALTSLLAQYVLPVAVLVSAAATTATATFAWRMYRSQALHDRALFGDDELGHPGVLKMVRRNRQVLEREDLLADDDERGS